MPAWSLLRRPRVEGSTLVSIAQEWVEHKEEPHHIDMLVVILRDVRRDSSAHWLTPVSLEFQALCASGRYPEAQAILDQYPDLRVKGQDGAEYLRKWRGRVAERTASYESEYERLWQLVNGETGSPN